MIVAGDTGGCVVYDWPMGYNALNDEIRDNITGCGVMRKIAIVCFGVMIISPAYSDDVSKGNNEKVLQCSLRPEELIGLDDLGLSAKCGAFSSRVSYAYEKTKVDRFTYRIGSKPGLYVRMRNGIVESAHKP